MKRKLTRKTLFLLMAVCLVLTLLAASAWADNETVTYPGTSLSTITIGSGSYNNALAPTPTGASNNNRVTVNDTSSTTFPDFVFGGYSTLGASTGNTVTLNSGATVNYSVFGGFATNGGSATGNTVILNSGATVPNVYGGWTEGAGNSSGNTVILNPGATVNVDVYGGMLGNSSGVTADNNTVIFHSGAIVNGNVYGGSRFWTVPIGAGNTLELRGAGQNIGGDLAGFQNLNFYLPSTLVANDTMLSVTGTATITGATVNVGIDGASSPLAKGDTVTLISAGTLTGTPANTTANGQGMQGVTLRYEFDILADSAANQLLATVTSSGINPQTKALPEGRAAGAAFLNAGADLVSESGMSGAWGRQLGSFGSYTFGGASYGATRTKTGSHVDTEGFSVMGGIARDFQKPNGRLTLGVFLEGGRGSYDAYNDFANYAAVNSSGDTNYYGLGIAVRYEGDGDEKGRFYGDGAARFGKTETDFTSDLLDASGNNARYDSDAAYFGAHFGVGYIKNINESSNLDFYTKLLWTRQGSDTVTLSTGDPVKFDATDSIRWRTGLRYGKLARDNKFRWYVGAAYEHEFGGDANASANGYAIDAPSMEGGTGIGELGFTYQKSPNDPFSLDLNISGYTGQREGVSGRLEMNWKF
jgi:hypothetical protein